MSNLNASIVKNTESRSYDAVVNNEIVASLVYDIEGAHVALTHMFVLPEFRHHGISAAVIEAAIDDVRRSGMTITVLCEAVQHYLSDHPDQQDVISAEDPGYPVSNRK